MGSKTILPAFVATSFVALAMQACATRHAVVAVTGTTIGVEISENPQTQIPQAKLGYNRAETAIVPSNRSAGENPGSHGAGAKDTTDVLMELRYGNIFSLQNSGIYQRLAVGSNAVQQPGAAYMFAKDASGHLNEGTADAISRALSSVPSTPPEIRSTRNSLAVAYAQLSTTKQAIFDSAANSAGFPTFRDFLLNRPATPTPEQVASIRKKLEEDPQIKAELAELDQ